MKPPAEVAQRDQFLAEMRELAETQADIFAEFVKVGFTRDEALSLLIFYLAGDDDDA